MRISCVRRSLPWTSWQRMAISCSIVTVLTTACSHGQPGTQPTPAQSAASGSTSTTITSDEIARAPSESIDQYLSGRVAGVDVTRSPDGGIAIRIRGGSSLQGNNEPLYVVDGIVTYPGADGGLTGINPFDIDSIRVLKDAADITMYGVRGANGVIVIKTKRRSPPLND